MTQDTNTASGAADLTDTVCKAMRRAWQLGKTYWQQADSESFIQHKKSETTHAAFVALLDDTRAALAAAQAQQPWQYTPPAQERIQALELEVRQLTGRAAALRKGLELAIKQNSHDMLMTGEELRQCEAALAGTAPAPMPSPTPQADSQPAPVLDYPHALRFGGCPSCGRSDCVAMACTRVNPDELLHIAARAPADSVLEDAARWEFRWLNPANNLHVAPSDLGWKTVNSKGMRSEKEVLEDLQAYRYQGKPVYEVRPLFATRALEKPEIRCPVRLANGGDCPRHNLQCGWPDCNKESK